MLATRKQLVEEAEVKVSGVAHHRVDGVALG